MSQYASTKNCISYHNVRLIRDAKHFDAGNDKPAATYVTFFHSTKDGRDIAIDARIVRGAKLFSGLRKGDIVSLSGSLTFKMDKKGENVIGHIWDVAEFATTVDLKGRNGAAASESDAPSFE